jgi:hypothetical protein
MSWSRFSFFAAAAIAAAVASPARANEWNAHFGQTASEYQQEFDKETKAGFRLHDIGGYSVDGEARYAAIFRKAKGPAYEAKHGLSAEQYQQEFDKAWHEGLRPVRVSAYPTKEGIRFAAVFVREPHNLQFAARHGLDSAAYQAEFNKMEKEGYSLIDISGYKDGATVRYAAIFEKGPKHEERMARHGLTSADYQKVFDEEKKAGWHLLRVNCYDVGGDPQYAAIWGKGAQVKAWEDKHGLTGPEFQKVFDELTHKGYELTHVSGCGTKAGPRFSLMFSK